MTRGNRRPSVALVAHGIHDHGGMERAFYELVRRSGGEYDFVVLATDLAEDLRSGVRWLPIRVPRRPIPLKTLLFFVVAGLKLRRAHVDLVHTLGAVVPNRADLATVQFCHAGHLRATGGLAPAGGPPLRRLNTTLARVLGLAAERWCYRPGRVRLLAPVSVGVGAELNRHYPGLPIVLTPNGVDLERFRPDPEGRRVLRREHGAADDEVVALLVGGDWDHKGVGVAIEGIARAQSIAGVALRLWVVGRGDERRFAAQAEQVGAEVTFFGPRSDAERFYRAADIFVLPTLYETFSLAAHEAAASGLPVVATRVNGIEDLIGDDEAGRVVEHDAEAVGAAIAELARDSDLRARLGEVGRGRASLLTWERSVSSVTAAYAELIGDRRA